VLISVSITADDHILLSLNEQNKFTPVSRFNYLKINPMLLESSLISQFQHENETWKRMLIFIREEGINNKNRLSEIVRDMDHESADMLNQIEYFQNCFVAEDAKVRQLVKDVEAQNNLVVRDIYEDGIIKSVKSNQAKLRKEMEKMEKEFNKLKFDFNSYLGEALSL
jgi:hypothetical protein